MATLTPPPGFDTGWVAGSLKRTRVAFGGAPPAAPNLLWENVCTFDKVKDRGRPVATAVVCTGEISRSDPCCVRPLRPVFGLAPRLQYRAAAPEGSAPMKEADLSSPCGEYSGTSADTPLILNVEESRGAGPAGGGSDKLASKASRAGLAS